MPALTVSIDDMAIATVCTDGYEVVVVHAFGTRIDEAAAILDMSGTRQPEHGVSLSHTWISAVPLSAGQKLSVRFLEDGVSSHAGKTIDELFPDAQPVTQTDFTTTPAMLAELKARPTLHDKFSFRLGLATAMLFEGEAIADAHGYGFSILWDRFRPDNARLSLHSYTLSGVELRAPLHMHVEQRIRYGDVVNFEVLTAVDS